MSLLKRPVDFFFMSALINDTKILLCSASRRLLGVLNLSLSSREAGPHVQEGRTCAQRNKLPITALFFLFIAL